MRGFAVGRVLSVAIALAALGSCDSGPKSGELMVELVTPHAQLGAASFRVTAVTPASIESVVAECTGCAVYTARVSDREVRGVVTGRFGAGPVIGVVVSDVSLPDAYAFQLYELAAPDYTLRNLVGSSLRIVAD